MNPFKKKTRTEKVKEKTEEVAKTVKDAVADNPRTAAAVGLAAATAVGAAAFWKSRTDVPSDARVLHVVSDGEGAWELRDESIDESLQRHETKRDAIRAAREYAREHTPSVLAIHREDGEVTTRHSYGDA